MQKHLEIVDWNFGVVKSVPFQATKKALNPQITCTNLNMSDC